MKELRGCIEKETASRILAKLKILLNMNSKNGVSNSFYCPLMWEYLEKNIFLDLDRICKWTIAHLSSSFWAWSQGIESRNNVDLNVWNFGKMNITVEECIFCYQQIDKIEVRRAYLHFLESQYNVLTSAILSKRKI